MDKDWIAIAIHADVGMARVAMGRVAEHMRRRTSVPMLLKCMTWPRVT
jgi:hypothetical protein